MKKEKSVKDEPAFVSAPLGIGKNTHRHIRLEKQKQNLETRIFFVLCSKVQLFLLERFMVVGEST